MKLTHALSFLALCSALACGAGDPTEQIDRSRRGVDIACPDPTTMWAPYSSGKCPATTPDADFEGCCLPLECPSCPEDAKGAARSTTMGYLTQVNDAEASANASFSLGGPPAGWTDQVSRLQQTLIDLYWGFDDDADCRFVVAVEQNR